RRREGARLRRAPRRRLDVGGAACRGRRRSEEATPAGRAAWDSRRNRPARPRAPADHRCRRPGGGLRLRGAPPKAVERMSPRSRTSPKQGSARQRHRYADWTRPSGADSTNDMLDTDALVTDRDTRIIVCCGSGGVGKTTASAALALRAAERGRKVCVLTIDPARRLAQSMGLTELDNVPRPVPEAGANGGSLDAMMLDMKRTFDEVVESHASPEKARQILENPFYIALSSSFAEIGRASCRERVPV